MELIALNLEQAMLITSYFINIVIAAILTLYIAYIYRSTHKGLSYSQSFTHTIIIMGTVMSVVIMAIGSSLATAIGVFGAFTIVRFRTIVKDTKDAAFLIYSLAIGMAVGTYNYPLAIVGTLLISAVIYVLYKFDVGSIKKFEYVVRFVVDMTDGQNQIYKEVFGMYLNKYQMLNVKSLSQGKELEMTFEVGFKKEDAKDDFVIKLEGLRNIKNVSLLNSKNDITW